MTDTTTPPVPELGELERLYAGARPEYVVHTRCDVFRWLLAQAREAERLRASYADTMTRLAALSHELRPILAGRPLTPENVTEAVGHYAEARSVLEELRPHFGLLAEAAERARGFPHSEGWDAMLKRWSDWHYKNERLSAAAARSEPEGRE